MYEKCLENGGEPVKAKKKMEQKIAKGCTEHEREEEKKWAKLENLLINQKNLFIVNKLLELKRKFCCQNMHKQLIIYI